MLASARLHTDVVVIHTLIHTPVQVTIDTSAFFSANRVFTDALMACPARRGASWATKQGQVDYPSGLTAEFVSECMYWSRCWS
jgi:hypothetical protein